MNHCNREILIKWLNKFKIQDENNDNNGAFFTT